MKPNILWICSDQQRFDALGCYGNRFVQTPNIDRLAENGVLFEHAFCQSPVCTPSRASFLTGRYPRTTRCRQNGQTIPADEVLVTRILADHGYSCGLAGKFHLAPCHVAIPLPAEREINGGYQEFHWSHHPYPDRPNNEYIEWLRERGIEYHGRPFEGSKHVQVSMPSEHHHTTWCFQKAINFIESHAAAGPSAAPGRSMPWLFSINLYDPHHPFDPPEELLRRYLDRLDEVPLPNHVPGELENKPSFQRKDHAAGPHVFDEMSEHDHRLIRAGYWAMCDLIDQQVGRVLTTLHDTGQLEDTLVIYMSDHGEMLGDHGLYFKGPYFYDCAVRVPLIISPPARTRERRQGAGKRSSALVELVDLAPTLLDVAGLPRHPGMQGRSLWPMLTGQADLTGHREDVYCESYNANHKHRNPPAFLTMLRTRRHKLVVVHGSDPFDKLRAGEGELYDLEADPLEMRNLWSDPAHVGLKADLLKRMCDRMAWTADPLPPRLAPW